MFLDTDSARKTIAINKNTVYVSLKSLFGASFSANYLGVIAEVIVDMMNEVLSIQNLLSLINTTSHYEKYHRAPRVLDKDIPIEKAVPLLEHSDLKLHRIVDPYIDDFISICLDDMTADIHEATIVFRAATNVFDCTFKHSFTNSADILLPRNVALSLRKFLEEGTPAEVQIVLG